MNLTRIERGWAGHFVMGIKCQWHRNTLILDSDSGRGIIVSSVGQLPDENHPDKYIQIGAFRYYETMVFIARQEGEYMDADVTRQVFPETKWYVSDYPEGTTDLKAEEIHEHNVAAVLSNFETYYKEN